MNFSPAKAFTKTPSVLYLNFLREFWFSAVASDLNPPIDNSKARPLKEFIIKFIAVKAELAKIATNEALVYKNPILKTSFLVASFESKKSDPQDSKGNKHPADMGLPLTHPDKGITTTKPFLEGTNTEPKDLGRLKPLADNDSSTPLVTALSGTDAEYHVDKTQSTRFEVSVPDQHQRKTSFEVELDFKPLKLTNMADIQALLINSEDEFKEVSEDDVFEAGEKMDEDIQQTDEEETQSPEPFNEFSTKIPTEEPAKHEEAVESYADLRAVIKEYVDGNADHQAQINAAMNKTMDHTNNVNTARATMQSMAKTNTLTSSNITNLTELLRNAKLPEEESEFNQRILRSAKGYIQNSSRLTEIASNLKAINFPSFQAKITAVENTQLRNTILKIPIPQPEQPKTQHTTLKLDTRKGIARDIDKSLRKLVKASTEVRLDPDAPVCVPFEINGKLYHLINEEIQAHYELEERNQKAVEEVKLLEMNKCELIKVVHEESANAEVDPKILTSAKGGQEFKKIQDAEIKVLNKKHSKKIKKANELKKKIIDQYRWTTCSRLKPETITNIHIHPNSMSVIITICKGNDQSNFDVFNPFKFSNFEIHTRASNSELVEPLSEPEHTLNQRLRRQNRRVLFDQRNNPPQHPRIVYPPILNINYFRHFLDILRNYDLIDDEPMWAADRVVALTPGSVITIPTAKEFAIKVGKFTFLTDFVIPEMEEDSKVPLILRRPFLHTTDAVIQVKQKQLNLGVGTERMIFNIDSAIKHSYLNDDTCFIIDIIDEILEEYFDALLDEGSKILHSIKGTILEEEIFSEFDTFIAMAANENYESKSDEEEPKFHCKDAHLVLNSEKCHFMVKEGIVLGHKVSGAGLKVEKAKIDVISKLPPSTNIKVFAFDKFRSYLILSKTIVHTDHSALKHLFKKQDAKPRLIRWILLLQEFDIEIKDKKGIENVAADHLSQIDNNETSDGNEVDYNFPRETLMEINTRDEPWFAEFANYLVGDIIPKGMTYQQKNKFFSDLKHYFWEGPYLFKVCSDGMIRRCVYGPETRTILDQCHHRPTNGHYGPNVTAKKVLDSDFYWPTIIKEAHTLRSMPKDGKYIKT
ncbi:reverse transcriptase domain-containing protein [Tanacetum coccineum]|uniref:Reverse transcriptase domain-containing protein n=1 Tax=Tanacetum coccineum TaxID=301880 RepID=A0ABQ4WWK0_9ASTR